MSTKYTTKTDKIDAVLAELKPVFDQIEKQLRAVGWRKRHGRWYSPQGLTATAEARRLHGDRNGKH